MYAIRSYYASVTGWCVLALASGKSLGLQVDDAALRASLAFLDSCGTPYARAQDCELQPCVDGACEENLGCGNVPVLGRCAGDSYNFV